MSHGNMEDWSSRGRERMWMVYVVPADVAILSILNRTNVALFIERSSWRAKCYPDPEVVSGERLLTALSNGQE